MMLRPTSALRPGLSLLEVILAFAIFMMSFAGISQLITMGHQNSLDASQQSTGTRLAQSKLAEVEAGIIAVNAPSSGAFEEAPGWNWEVQILDMPAANVHEVMVRTWFNSNNRVEVKLTQYIVDPAFIGTAAPAQPPVPPEEETTGTTP